MLKTVLPIIVTKTTLNMSPKIILAVAFLAVGASVAASSIAVRATNNYYYSSQLVSFAQAWAYCKNAGLKFISLPSAAQNDALAQSLSALGAPTSTFWIGGIYLRNGFLNKWYWVDGQEDFNYVNWARTPTPATTVDNCVAYSYTASTKKGNWTSGNCAGARYFICEI